jgi:predicted transcriptional regulator
MATAKDTVRKVLEQMPDDCSLEDVQYQLYQRQRLDRSRQAAAEGRIVSHAEVKERLSKWAGK